MLENNAEGLLTKLDAKVCSEESKVWIFQAVPKRYNLLDRLMEVQVGDEDVWMVNQYKNDILSGHIGILWLAGKQAGIYSLVEIISDPEYMVDSEDSTKHWKSDEDKRQKALRVRIKFKLKLLHDKALRKDELKSVLELKNNLSILRRWRGTNFPVSKEEWLVISDLIRKKFEQKQ